MTPLLQPGSIFAERYRIEGAVAAGGFGRVYRGRHLVLDAPVAIKILRPERFVEAQDRAAEVDAFLREARTLAKMRHPNIVQVLDAGVATDTALPWMVLAWCDGKTLADLTATNGVPVPMSPLEAWQLLRPAALAIAYAHEQGITHRDIKPANLMFVPEGGTLSARVLDFGIAKTASSRGSATMSGVTPSSTGNAGFTPGYAAPEQITSLASGPWTDVHALALVFTELVTGTPAYEPGRALLAAVSPTRPTPRAFDVDVGEAIERVLARALALSANERQPSASQFTSELDAAIAATPPAIASRRSAATRTRAPAPNGTSSADGVSIGSAATELASFHASSNTTAPHAMPLASGPPAPTIAALPEPKRSSRGATIAIAALAAVLVLGGGGGAAWYFTSGPGSVSSTDARTKAKSKKPKSVEDETPTATVSPRGGPGYPPKATLAIPVGALVKDRSIPKYDPASLAKKMEEAGYTHEPLPGTNTQGYVLVVYKVTRPPCGGSVQYFEVDGIDSAMTGMRKMVDPKYAVAQDDHRGLIVALDSLPEGANVDCIADVFGRLTSPR